MARDRRCTCALGTSWSEWQPAMTHSTSQPRRHAPFASLHACQQSPYISFESCRQTLECLTAISITTASLSPKFHLKVSQFQVSNALSPENERNKRLDECAQADINIDEQPELYAPPLAQLLSDFPLQPSLLGNLVPHQINLWMGCAPNGEAPLSDPGLLEDWDIRVSANPIPAVKCATHWESHQI